MKKRHLLQISAIGLLLTCQVTLGATEMQDMNSFDAAPFGIVVDDGDPKTYAVKWAEPRKIRRVVVTFDETVVTVRSDARSFSFRADDIAHAERILVDDLGVLVTRGDDDISIDQYREALKEYPGKTVYDRVDEHAEQTLMRAWDHMPIKRQLWFVHGLPGNRNAFRQSVNGDLLLTMNHRWMTLPRSANDTKRRHWKGTLNLRFGFPTVNGHAGRELKEGYLPQVRTWFQDGPIFYEQSTILDTLDGDMDDITLDDPTVMFVRIRLVNTSSHEEGTARLRFASAADGVEQVELKDGRLLAVDGDKKHIRFLIDRNSKGELAPKGGHIEYTRHLAPGDHHTLYVKIPSITINNDEAKQLTKRGFEEVSRRVCDFWHALTERGTQIHTAEPWLDDFHKTHARHLMVNCFKEIDSDRLHAHVGTFSYGVYPNESAMMISDLDRRGYHKEARQNLDSFLHYQGTVGMNGNFTTVDGQFYGAGGHETGNYNKSHGYVLWLMAEHWWMTRDREWMERAAPGLIKGCEWVIQQRRTTMKTNPDGSKPIEYGFLPAGSLEDVTDYWYWLATNSATVWGFLNLADAIADFGQPSGQELQTEAKAYYDDFMAAMTEARIRAPVVKLRDETYVPKFPSRLYERGRCHGWLRETLEGAIFMPAYKLLEPESIETQWILKDYEDNLYISDRYGYSIPAFDAFWFDRGGFSMQANLLDGPLPYLYRDEIKHYLRAFFNGFASAFYPEIRMCNEHSLPELGYPAGDHFKSSDEAQVTYWLRLMFVHERDNNLYLGQAIPRYWLASNKTIGIEKAASNFGPLSFRMKMNEKGKQVTVSLNPPERNNPEKIYLRIRHPKEKKIKNVSVNGSAHDAFDVDKEWIVLPGDVTGQQEIIVRY